MMFFSLVQCAILLGVFSSWILSSIFTEYRSDLAQDSVEVYINKIKEKEITMVSAQSDIWFFEKILRAKDFPYRQFKDALEVNPLVKLNKTLEAMDKISEGGAITFAQHDDETRYASLEYCNVKAVMQDMPLVTAHLMFR